MIRLFGAVLLVSSGGMAGYLLCRNLKSEEKQLSDLLWSLSWMEDQLRYKRTPLPELLLEAGDQISGDLRQILTETAELLVTNRMQDCSECMTNVLHKYPNISGESKALLQMLGASLGQFDLAGQLNQLALAKEACNRRLEQIRQENPGKLKTYQSLGLCAGAALAILLI